VADNSCKGLILVVDSKDRSKIQESSEILYEILNNNTVLENKTPILIVCNKQDLQFARRCTHIQQELEKEIEELRKVRRVTEDERDSKSGYLEQGLSSSKKFTFSDAEISRTLPKISFIETSIKKD